MVIELNYRGIYNNQSFVGTELRKAKKLQDLLKTLKAEMEQEEDGNCLLLNAEIEKMETIKNSMSNRIIFLEYVLDHFQYISRKNSSELYDAQLMLNKLIEG